MADIKSASLIRDEMIDLMVRHAEMLNELADTAGNRDADWHMRNGQAANNTVADLCKLVAELATNVQALAAASGHPDLAAGPGVNI